MAKAPVKFLGRLVFNYNPNVSLDDLMLIYDRLGECVDKIAVNGDCLAFEWSPNGDFLALAQSKSPSILLWDASHKKLAVNLPDAKMKHVNFLKWSLDSKTVFIDEFL
jgi:WD40 repeat protein